MKRTTPRGRGFGGLAAGVVALGMVAAGLVEPAGAEAIARTEAGSVPMRIVAVSSEGPWTTRIDGGVFATLTLSPFYAVRVTRDVNRRNRPGPTPGFATGTMLFGYQLEGGMAYCEPLRINDERRVQCFRDFNNDGTFDGGYVSANDYNGGRYLISQLESLVPVAPLAYAADGAFRFEAMAYSLSLASVGEERARFRVQAGDETWEERGVLIDGTTDEFLFSSGRYRIASLGDARYTVTRLVIPSEASMLAVTSSEVGAGS
ncbi:MAG: hypothetical protein ACOYKM_10435 [Caulobacterales bacterium]|jgi:hypothetical protein